MAQYSYFKTNQACHQDVYRRLSVMRKALFELQEKSKQEITENKKFWEEKIQRVKEETEQEWREKLTSTKEQLWKNQMELSEVQKENVTLRGQLELRALGSPTCHCNSKIKYNGFGEINGMLVDDEASIIPQGKSSNPTKETKQDCDRLRSQLMEMEQRADQLNLLLNQKLIELNKLQLTLSKQTKEMILLEKAYFHLRCHLSKRGNKTFSTQFSPSCWKSSSLSSKSTSSTSLPPEIPP